MIASTLPNRLADRLAKLLTPPPEPLRLLEFARTTKFRKGRKVEQYRPEGHPPQFFFLEAFERAIEGRGPYRHFVTIKPTQDGGTMATQSLPQVYITSQLGDPVAAGCPDMRIAGIQWRDKTRKLILDSGREDLLPVDGPGSDGSSNPTSVELGGGALYYMGGGASNQAGQAALTARALFRDERDSMDPYVAELMTGRIESFQGAALISDTSTIKFDDGSPVLEEYERSTLFHVEYACVHCGRFVQWQWSHVHLDLTSARTARDSAHLVCPHCKGEIDDARRLATLRLEHARLVSRGQTVDATGQVVGPLPDSLVWGLLWTALDSPLIALSTLAVQYAQAAEAVKMGNHELLRRFHRDRLCKVYVQAGGTREISNRTLAEQSALSDFDKRQVPHWASYLTVGQDVQGDRHYWLVMAFSALGDQFAVIDWGYEYLVGKEEGQRVPGPIDRIHVLDRVQARCALGWQRAGSEERLAPIRRGCDVGFDAATVVPWIAGNGQWISCKGVGRDQAQRMDRAVKDGTSLSKLSPALQQRLLGLIDIRQPDTMPVPLANVNGHAVRELLHAALLRRPGEPSSCWLPQGLKSNDYLLLHLSAEVWTQDVRTNKWYWKEVRTENHLLDCATYALGIGIYHREALKLAEVSGVRTEPESNSMQPHTSQAAPPSRQRFERRHSRLRR